MRVAIDIQNLLLPRTGIGYYVEELLSGLSRLDVDDVFYPFYFSSRRRLNLPFSNEVVRECQVKDPRVRVLGRLWKWFNFPKIDRFLPEVDMYHFPNFFMRPHRRGKRILTIHDLSYVRHPEYTEARNLEFLTRKVKEAVDGVAKVIVISEFTKREVMDHYGLEESRVEAIHLGVREVFHEEPEAEFVAKVREKYRLPERYVLFVGTIEPRKNLIGLVEGFSRMQRENPELSDVKLVVCGMPGWLYEDTIRRMEEPDVRDKIIRTGYTESEELPVLYREAAALAMPSWYEGFGFPALESMACGTPVLCSEKTSISEITGDAAVLMNPGDPDSIADGLRRILTDGDLRKRLTTEGKERAKGFTWEKTARKTYEVYKSVA